MAVKEPTVYDVLRTLVEHSTLNGADKYKLAWDLDYLDPDAEQAEPAPVVETPEEELTRLRQESAERKAAEQNADTVPQGA